MEVLSPIGVASMLPTLMSINGIIPMTPDVRRKPWKYASLIIPGGIVVTKIVVVIPWTQEETVGKHP